MTTEMIELDEELARTEYQRRPTMELPALESPEAVEAEALRRVTRGGAR